MKSHEKDSLKLLANVINDYASMCGVEQDVRDMQKITYRVEHEGFKFLTITLPKFGDAFFTSIENGSIETTSFQGFRIRRGIPVLFGVFLSRVFDTSGALLVEPDPLAIAAIRQISYQNKKLKENCDEDKISSAFKRFIKVEQELADFTFHVGDWNDFSRLCHIMWGDILPQINIWNTVPKHGPGATADKLTSNKKYKIGYWPDRSEGYFPLISFGLPSENAIESKMYDSIRSCKIDEELPVRLIAVPKTAKAPRLIAIEPTCMQYMQQALAHVLMHALEDHHIFKGHINFKSQRVNQDLAVQSSRTRQFATLDLSDASDRVHNKCTWPLFQSNPDFYGAIQACRSLNVNVNGEILPLTKFASMGSALCFPIESMLFYTLCVLGLLRSRKAPIDFAHMKACAKSIYVYGDDIICPVEATPEISATLEAFGLKVNVHKSFSKSHFRESCGADAFNGQDVTPVYIRTRIPADGKDASSILSLVATSNLFYKKGLWLTATAIKEIVERLIGTLPVLGDEAEGVGWSSFTFKPPYIVRDEEVRHKRVRWSKRYQRIEYHTLVASVPKRKDVVDDYPALLKFFLNPSPECIGGVEVTRNNEQSSRFGTVTLKRRWTRPY